MKTFEHEPIAGLPEQLPEGEYIIWQGAPSWRYLVRHAFRIRPVLAYFGFFIALRALVAAEDSPLPVALGTTVLVVPLALTAVGILALMAWAHARTTVYTLTNRRWVFRYGIALPMMVNLPFEAVISAEFSRKKSGEGDLPIKLGGGTGPGYAYLWPHVRPWRLTRPEPCLRGIPEVQKVAALFAEALIAFREGTPGPAPATSAKTQERAARRPAPLGMPATAE